MRWVFVGCLLGDSSKGSGSSLGTHREIVGRRPEDSPQEYQRLLDWRESGKPPIPRYSGDKVAQVGG
ncbi:hypothetical protein BHE74_00043524 [Ensete ventricosum]|nr:hypothetical protein GW17_00034654 [Ensete ventricosum]RWW50232.1 hypothetical protein BHE74_00043524 [Ensete ventricosum]RZS16502.1 hypothetical protein BHM03_00048495 [Ensete ventricosum]